jgi:hypothetical protein
MISIQELDSLPSSEAPPEAAAGGLVVVLLSKCAVHPRLGSILRPLGEAVKNP